MTKKKGIKEGKLIPLDEIHIIEEACTRQTFIELTKNNMVPEPGNTGQHNEKVTFDELVASMQTVGQLECIAVREDTTIPKELLEEDGLSALYYLVTGLRRLWAAQTLGWKNIKAVVLY
jgi:ParB-like chromosome segregation protein Spo0J